MTNALDIRQHIIETAHDIIVGKGFSAVGLNEILKASDVPKGSFYHYFGSKEAFGKALLENYFEHYLGDIDEIFSKQAMSVTDRVIAYFTKWRDEQMGNVPKAKCLVVKLAAEVSDLSEELRLALNDGTTKVIGRLTDVLEEAGYSQPHELATTLYQLWLGASVQSKVTRTATPMDAALVTTQLLLGSGR